MFSRRIGMAGERRPGMDDGEKSRRAEDRLCTHELARHLWVVRANPGPQTYVCTSLELLYIPFDSNVTVTYLPTLPYLPHASSRTSAPVTQCQSNLRTVFEFPPPSSFIATSFLVCIGPPLHPFRRSSLIARREPSLHIHSAHMLRNR